MPSKRPAISPFIFLKIIPPPPNKILDKPLKEKKILFYDLTKVYFFWAKLTLSEHSLLFDGSSLKVNQCSKHCVKKLTFCEQSKLYVKKVNFI